MADDTTNQREAAPAAKPSVEQQDAEMTSTSDAPQTAEQRTAERRERRARNNEEYNLERPILDVGNRISMRLMTRDPNGAFTKIPAQRLGDADLQTDLRGTISNRSETQTKDLNAPQTAEQQAVAARRARRKEMLSLDRIYPISDAGNKISLKAMTRGPNGAFTSLRAVNHTGGRQTDLRGTISKRPEIPTKGLDAAQSFIEEQLRNVKAGDSIRITSSIYNDDGVLQSHSVYNSAEVQQNKREQHLMGHRKPEKDDPHTISERDVDAMDDDRQRKRPRGDSFQTAAPSQGGFHHKNRRGRRGQGSSKKTQSQAPGFQQQGNQNSPWASPKPSNSRLAALTVPQAQSFHPDITKTPSSSFAYGQPVMSQVSRSQPTFNSKPFSADTNANVAENDQKRLFLGQPKPTPTTTANADLDAIPVKAEKEEDDYYTSSVRGYTRPFRDFQ